ncbi:hypothetical protein [Aneurinibacillus uraniidurans]|uniref:hypothetical protein n=1 Tax=Aneurinibacillus uraniidurans TaxID=2966586 RepID=UPI00234B572D|nr:hypothetical protein [Aneurinibacillus sp. B1]WCN37927.1 hypothetical protein PO771_00365 [Aneurinibacillus sp. B1]
MLKKRKTTFFASLFLGTALTFTPLSFVQAEGESTPGSNVALDVSWSAAAQAKVTIVNNAGKPSTVTVTGLPVGALVEVYDQPSGGKVIGKGTVKQGPKDTEAKAVISIRDFGDKVKVYISVTMESTIVPIDFAAKQQSKTPVDGDVTVTNKVRAGDTVEVKNLTVGDTVKVYYIKLNSKLEPVIDPKTNKPLIATATAKVAKDKTSATVSISQLGESGGTVQVSVTSDGKLESVKLDKSFEEEKQSNPPAVDKITVHNYAKMADTVEVTGLTEGDTVKVYYKGSTGKEATATATVARGKTSAIVNIAQLGTGDGSVDVTVTSKDKRESVKINKTFEAEEKTKQLDASVLELTPKSATEGSLKVSVPTQGDTVKVYQGDKLLATTTVGSTKTATIGLRNLVEGELGVTVTSKGYLESDRTTLTFTPPSK